MKERSFRFFCSGLIDPKMRKKSRTRGVFHGFIGVIAFIAYALPLMLVTSVLDYAAFTPANQDASVIDRPCPGTTATTAPTPSSPAPGDWFPPATSRSFRTHGSGADRPLVWR